MTQRNNGGIDEDLIEYDGYGFTTNSVLMVGERRSSGNGNKRLREQNDNLKQQVKKLKVDKKDLQKDKKDLQKELQDFKRKYSAKVSSLEKDLKGFEVYNLFPATREKKKGKCLLKHRESGMT